MPSITPVIQPAFFSTLRCCETVAWAIGKYSTISPVMHPGWVTRNLIISKRMGLPRALSMRTSRCCSFPDIFNVQHAAGIAVFICAIVFKSVYRIFTINNIRLNSRLSTPKTNKVHFNRQTPFNTKGQDKTSGPESMQKSYGISSGSNPSARHRLSPHLLLTFIAPADDKICPPCSEQKSPHPFIYL